MPAPCPLNASLPTAKAIKVDTRGAVILHEHSKDTKDSRGIYFPNFVEPVSHIAVDIGGSLAKVIYFTRSPNPPDSPPHTNGTCDACSTSSDDDASTSASQHQCIRHSTRTGALTPLVLESSSTPIPLDSPNLSRRLATAHFPGGSLNFERFETANMDLCAQFIAQLIERSALLNNVPVDEMKRSVKITATGGGAHLFYEKLDELGVVEVRREDEMACLIEGLRFIAHIPEEVYFFSDELIHTVTHASPTEPELERPSASPPQYTVSFATDLTPQLPCLLVNIGSGVSIVKVSEDGSFERVSGTSLGGGTLWGLLSMLTPANSFDEMLALSESGDNASVDMLVGDIYGQDYSRLGLKSTTIASSFGKVFSQRKGKDEDRAFRPEDISRSLLYAISNNIGQIAYMNAEKYGVDKIYFGGYFIRGHAATVATLSYAIRFWSKGTKRALFLRHEGFLGAMGAWIKNIEDRDDIQSDSSS